MGAVAGPPAFGGMRGRAACMCEGTGTSGKRGTRPRWRHACSEGMWKQLSSSSFVMVDTSRPCNRGLGGVVCAAAAATASRCAGRVRRRRQGAATPSLQSDRRPPPLGGAVTHPDRAFKREMARGEGARPATPRCRGPTARRCQPPRLPLWSVFAAAAQCPVAAGSNERAAGRRWGPPPRLPGPQAPACCFRASGARLDTVERPATTGSFAA